jgi:universal stress protein A
MAGALRFSMSTPTQILVPIDFSESSEHALAYAVGIAAKLDATLHLVNAIGLPAMGAPEIGLAYTASMIEQITTANQTELEALAATTRASAKVGAVLVRAGDARDVILSTADELGADLIVMGTHGRRGLSRALLGSIAETVVRHAQVPVLTVRGPKEESRQLKRAG